MNLDDSRVIRQLGVKLQIYWRFLGVVGIMIIVAPLCPRRSFELEETVKAVTLGRQDRVLLKLHSLGFLRFPSPYD